jgi:hypothetical protein
MVSCEINEDAICDISYFSRDHKSRNKRVEIFIASFTPEIPWIHFLYFSFATLSGASGID